MHRSKRWQGLIVIYRYLFSLHIDTCYKSRLLWSHSLNDRKLIVDILYFFVLHFYYHLFIFGFFFFVVFDSNPCARATYLSEYPQLIFFSACSLFTSSSFLLLLVWDTPALSTYFPLFSLFIPGLGQGGREIYLCIVRIRKLNEWNDLRTPCSSHLD